MVADSEVCNKLCLDVLVVILCLCDGKDLIRFKCVSKGWHSLISLVCIPRIYQTGKAQIVADGLYLKSLAFSDHMPGALYEPMKSDKLAISDDKIQVEYASLLDKNKDEHEHDHPGCLLVDSSSGLLLFVDQMNHWYYVCNPLIKQCVKIPEPTGHQSLCGWSALAFDPSKSIHYKIVRFARVKSALLIELDIYSSEDTTGQWIRHSVQLQSRVNVDHSQWMKTSVYFKGVMYKLYRNHSMLCLDLHAMTGHVIAVPKLSPSCGMGCIGVWNGRLSHAKRDVESMAFIWSLENCCETRFEWVLRHNFPCNPLINRVYNEMKPPLGRLFNMFEPRAFCPNSNVILFGKANMIVSYDFINDKLEEWFRTKDAVMCYGPYILASRCLISPKDATLLHKKPPQLK